MVVLVEPMCTGWEHEEVNAGLLKLIDCATDSRITYYGDQGQIRAVSRIYHSTKVNFKEIKEIPGKEMRDNNVEIAIYVKIFREIIKKCKPATVFVLSGDRPCMIAVLLLAYITPKVNFLMILHAILDPKLGNTSSCVEIMKKSGGIKNLCYITYSPFAGSILEKEGIRNTLFLNHPYIEAVNQASISGRHGNYKIGIIGACANMNAFRFVEAVSRECDIADKYDFWIASRNSDLFKGLKNVRILSSEFRRDYIERIMRQIDYLFLPYGRNDYRMAASGILWDAVSNKVPCLTYDSKYICYYQKRYHIGIQKDSLSAMIEALKELEKESVEQEEYFVHTEVLDEYNQSVIRNILKWRMN